MNNAAKDVRSTLVAAGVHLDTVNLTARVHLEGRVEIGRETLLPLSLRESAERPKSGIPRKHIYGDHALFSFRAPTNDPQRIAVIGGDEGSSRKQMMSAHARHALLPRGESLDPTIDWLPVIAPYPLDPLLDINQEVREDGLLMTGRQQLEKDLEGDTLNVHDDALRERLGKQPMPALRASDRQMPVRAFGESELSEEAHLRMAGRRIDRGTIETILKVPPLLERVCDQLAAARKAAPNLAHAKTPLQVIGQRPWSFMTEATKKNSAILQRRFKKALGHNRHNRQFANNANQPKRKRQAWQ